MYNHNRRGYGHHDRVNEQDVPESKHTVFVRGLPGSMTTDEVREFFEQKIGSCTFDFVKVTPDKERLCVAVRFETKECARRCMEKYNNGSVLGYNVELTWFRDIRRYVAHCQKQDVRTGVCPRVVTETGVIISICFAQPLSLKESLSLPTLFALVLVPKVTRQPQRREPTASPPPRRKSKKSKKDKKRKHKSPSHSRSPTPKSPARSARSPSKSGSDMETSDHENNASAENNKQPQQSPIKINIQPQNPNGVLQNTTFKVDLESNAPPVKQIKKTQEVEPIQPPVNGTNGILSPKKATFVPLPEENGDPAPPPVHEPPPSPQVQVTAVQPKVKAEVPAVIDTLDTAVIVPLNNFNKIQRAILQDVRYQPPEEDESRGGTLRLSSLSKAKSEDTIREERLAKLPVGMRDRAEKKKVQLELNYRQDCETFALVAKKLISKDRSLESPLRLALMETMKDLEKDVWKQFDEYVNELLFISA
ncbi:Protein Y57G11C.9 a [Aphelenchoides avenae]|nr:Protein Y57G11C.9 a [Aphelenchus avenae]